MRRLRPELSTRTYLTVLIAALLIPVLIFSGLLLSRFAAGERSRYQGDALDASYRIAAAVDRELTGLQSALLALSTSRSSTEFAFDRFHQRAIEVKRIIGADIILKDDSGQQLINTLLPLGSSLPRSLPEADGRALLSKQPEVSDLFTGATSQRPIISINIPLVREGQRTQLLIGAIGPERLTEILRAQALPELWTAAIVDGRGTIVARSREHDRFVGRAASQDLRDHAIGTEGTWVGTTADGTPVLSAYARPKLAPRWRVAVGVPVQAVETPLRRALLSLAGAGLAALGLSAVVAAWAGQRVSRAMQRLASSAARLGGSHPVVHEQTSLREVNEVGAALVRAADDLAERDRARTAAEESLRHETLRVSENEARLRALADNLPAGMVYQLAMARDGSARRFVYVSQTCERVTGVAADAALGDPQRLYSVIAPEHRGKLQEAEASAIERLSGFDYETAFRRADTGERRWARIVSAPRSGPEGTLIWDGLFVDVTEHRLAADALREREADLARVQEIGQVAGVYVELDHGFENYRSPEYLRLHGLPAEAHRESHEDWLARVHPDDREQVDRVFRAALAGSGRDYASEYRIIRPADGQMRWIGVKAQIDRDASGRPLRFVGAHIDITERKLAEEALRQLNETLEAEVQERTRQLLQLQKFESIGQLTGGVAHDFNNLLMAVLGSLELLRKRIGEDPRAVRLLENAVQGAQRGAALTQRLLAFARQQELAPEAVDVARLAGGMLDLLQQSLGPQIEIDLRFPRRLAPANVDANQLELAVLNLAVNGRDAMPSGGRLMLSAREEHVSENANDLRPGDYIVVAVSDSGEGMDDETLRRAAEPFFTTKGVGKGTGLGLSMVHGLAAQSGGRLVLKSQREIGTTAELWLPKATVAAAPMPAVVRPPYVNIDARRVMIVDDDPLVLAGTADLLEDLGHEVVEASSGRQALEILRAEARIDLVITDHAMPGMTGVELFTRAREAHPDIPFILATGYAELPDLLEAPTIRLSKPFKQDALAQAIGQALRSTAMPSNNIFPFRR